MKSMLLKKRSLIELEEDPPEPLNPFFVSTVFTVVGTGMPAYFMEKEKELFSSSPENKDPE